ncbi:hypothetical protein Tco_0509376 [Tanacetum coccineum]
MADKGKKSSMETFAPNDKADYYFGITSITVNGKNAYELKGKFLDDLHNHAFSGTNRKDAAEHIKYYLKIIDLIKLPNVDHDKLRIVVFPISLAGGEYGRNQNCQTYVAIRFNNKTGCSEWPTYSWREDGYCSGGNFPGAYHIGKSLHYQDLEWYEALEDSKLKDEALRNKAIMEGLISDDESSNDCWKRWKSHEIYYHDYDEGEYENETHEEGHEFCDSKLTIYRHLPCKVCKVWDDWEVDRYGNANLVITEYLVNNSKMRAFWSLNEDILKITIQTTNTPYPSRKIWRIHACTHQRPRKKQAQYDVKMDDPNISMEEYIGLEEEKARRRGKVYNWETATYGKKSDSKNDNEKVNMPSFPPPKPTVSCFDDLDFFKDFKNDFAAIVSMMHNQSKLDFLTEPTLSPQHIDEFNLNIR